MGLKAPIARTISVCLAAASISFGAILPFPSNGPTVSTDYDSVLIKTWEGMKKRNIDAYNTGLVHRPKSEYPGDAVSEGIGYGMLVALYANDQEYFNKIWQAGENTMWNAGGGFYDWRYENGAVVGENSATDADEDVALALIFADILVEKGVWEEFQLTTQDGGRISYAQRANDMINTFYSVMVENGRYVKPGSNFGSADHLNPGYFAPAFYRVWDAFEETDHDWQSVIDQCYETIEAAPGYELGMVPDWMKSNGEYTDGSTGYNGHFGGKMLFKDAIRILWRVATDYVWWGEPRAKKFLENAYEFIQTPDRANFYDMEGNLIPDSTYTAMNGRTLERPFREYSPLTLGMWICAAFGGGGPEAAEPFSDSLLTFYEGGDYWGRAQDPDGIEDTTHNEMYFDQFLAWFGASLVSGNFANLWPILTDPDPQTPTAWVQQPTFSIDTGYDANFNPVELTGILNKPVSWSISVENESGEVVYSKSGQGDTVSMIWLGTGDGLKPCPSGKYIAKINAFGFQEAFPAAFWLGRALDITDGSGMIIVDDFGDGNKKPYIGSGWNSFFGEDDYSRQRNSTEILNFAVSENNGVSELNWRFRLSGDFGWDPYAGLDWTIGPGFDAAFTGLDKIEVTAKSQDSLGVSVQLVQSDVTTFFLEDSLYLGQDYETFTLNISDFVPRLGSNTQLDLSKLTAVRFQVQLPEGTENEIVIREMKLGGDFSSFYQAPDEYVKMPENSVAGNRIRKSNSFAVRAMSNNSFIISAPDPSFNTEVRILSLNGRTVKTLQMRNGEAKWDGLSSSGTGVPSGVYVIAFRHKNHFIRKNILISK